jgi:hypothetical protein
MNVLPITVIMKDTDNNPVMSCHASMAAATLKLET